MLRFCSGPTQAPHKEVTTTAPGGHNDSIFDCCSTSKFQMCVQQVARTPMDDARHLNLNNFAADLHRGAQAPTAVFERAGTQGQRRSVRSWDFSREPAPRGEERGLFSPVLSAHPPLTPGKHRGRTAASGTASGDASTASPQQPQRRRRALAAECAAAYAEAAAAAAVAVVERTVSHASNVSRGGVQRQDSAQDARDFTFLDVDSGLRERQWLQAALGQAPLQPPPPPAARPTPAPAPASAPAPPHSRPPQPAHTPPRCSASSASASASPAPAAEEGSAAGEVDWSSGQVRVLLVASSSSFGAVSCGVATPSGGRTAPLRSALEGSLQLEQWCRRCGIADVTMLVLTGSTDPAARASELRTAARALGERAQPGDTCVVHIALAGADDGLAELCPSGAVALQDAAAREAPESVPEDGATVEEPLLTPLPEKVTVVCLGDSAAAAALLGLGEQSLGHARYRGDNTLKVLVHLVIADAPDLSPSFASCGLSPRGRDDGDAAQGGFAADVVETPVRAAAYSLSPCGSPGRGFTPSSPSKCLAIAGQSAGICCAALLRAADALSLADGPCSLSCRDFLAEVADQAADLAAAAGLPMPTVALRAHPSEATASEVRWPIAAAPRNKAKHGEALGPAVPLTLNNTVSKAWAAGAGGPRSASVPSCFPPVDVDFDALRARSKGKQLRGGGGDNSRRGGGGGAKLGPRRSMPMNLGGLTSVLSGGTVPKEAFSSSPCRQGPRRTRRSISTLTASFIPNGGSVGSRSSQGLSRASTSTAADSASASTLGGNTTPGAASKEEPSTPVIQVAARALSPPAGLAPLE